MSAAIDRPPSDRPAVEDAGASGRTFADPPPAFAREFAGLEAEWERVRLLTHCLVQSRRGREAGPEVLARLRDAHTAVLAGRRDGAWARLGCPPLAALEYDVLACAVAVEAEPRIGWWNHTLQPGLGQPYPTAALIQELLALTAADAEALNATLGEGGRLWRERLIDRCCAGPYEPIRPASGLTPRLMGWAVESHAPPGAVQVRSEARWDDLVLSPCRIEMLQELLWWVRHRSTVVQAWGGVDCGGPIALFCGPSGTGKTMAASVLANDLGWPLYRVDLGQLISKYVGETERNLNRLFDAADGRPMMLQFDEADSVFGKRGEIREARDRYANMEVSHLLARVESHRGPCILTSNLRSNVDPAFARRFQVVVEFPRPDAAERTELWRRLLPPRAPGVKRLDVDLLGRCANLTGGGIRNAALHAAYLAAGLGCEIRLEHVALAVWRELAKDGREVSPVDLGELKAHLRTREGVPRRAHGDGVRKGT